MHALVGEVPALARVPLLAAPFVLPLELDDLVNSESLELPRLQACRLDGLCQPDGTGLRFFEVRAGDPSGQGMADAMSVSLSKVEALKPWLAGAPSLVEARRAMVNRAFPHHRARVAFVNEDDAFLVADTELMARAFRTAGHEAVRVDPRNLEWDGRTLSANGHVIDAVLRDSHEELTVSPGRPATGALWSALQAGLARFNPFRDVWFDDKASFAMLWQQRETLPPDEREVVERHLPETRVVQQADVERLQAEQGQWVLKPAQGFGVTIGCDVNSEAWNRALMNALMHRTIAQRFVPTAQQPAAFLEGDLIAWRDQYLTFSFWCHGGQFAGAFGRAGPGHVVNAQQGGGLGPLVFS